MKTEYEATFLNIDKNEIQERLRKLGAKLIKPEFLQKRVTFNLPSGHEIRGAWIRVRDEADKVTMSLKIVDGDKIENQKEILAYLGGKMRMHRIKVLIGDSVEVVLDPYGGKGRIIKRL